MSFYQSCTQGSTLWKAEFPESTAKKENLSAYDTIIFGSFAYAGTIRKLDWFKKNLGKVY